MKFKVIMYVCVNILFVSCANKPRPKIFVKSAEVSKEIRIDWYVYSSISNFAPDYLQISNYAKKPFFKSFYLTDIHFRNDTLLISLWKNDYELDKLKLPGIKVIIDTLGEHWNEGASRIGRLRRRGINMEAPHFIDTYCPNGECE